MQRWGYVNSLFEKESRFSTFQHEIDPDKDVIFPLIKELRQITSQENKAEFVRNNLVLTNYKTEIALLNTALYAYFDGNKQIPNLTFAERQFLHDFRKADGLSLSQQPNKACR